MKKKKGRALKAVPFTQTKTVKQVKAMLKTTKDGSVLNTLQNYVSLCLFAHDLPRGVPPI